MAINPYLYFNGNCQEAMKFYQESLGGELSLSKFSDYPQMAKQAKKEPNKIMHSVLMINGNFFLQGSDMVGNGAKRGNMSSISLDCNSKEELKNVFSKLSREGKINEEPKMMFWGGYYGDLTDKFGVHWLLNYQKEAMPIPRKINPSVMES